MLLHLDMWIVSDISEQCSSPTSLSSSPRTLYSSKTLVTIYQLTWHNISEDLDLHIQESDYFLQCCLAQYLWLNKWCPLVLDIKSSGMWWHVVIGINQQFWGSFCQYGGDSRFLQSFGKSVLDSMASHHKMQCFFTVILACEFVIDLFFMDIIL